uniref:Methyl-CpG-binding domain-containing protein 13 n=1 Tax=Noccaea caerulescens TaxID=107243 RepID=A0A1J3E1X1_NOCCA
MDGEGISDGSPAERKVEIGVKKNGRKVTVEKSAAEGLPEGWIKKIIISNRPGRKDRRDPFFIDPKSEYIFQSFKDASRYVETGNLGHYARKLKESDIEDDDDSGNGKNVLLLESADDLLPEEKNINSKVISDLRIATSQVLEGLGNKEEAKDVMEKQPIAKRVTRSQAKATKNEEVDNVKSRLRSASSQSPVKKEVRDSTEKQITRSKAIVKKKKKNELTNSVARRASKRLAGIELEPTPELKTRAKSQRILPLNLDDGKCKQPVNLGGTGGLKKTDIPLNEEVAKSFSEQSSPPKPNVSAEMEVQIEKICKPLVGRSGSGDDKKMKMPLVWEQNPVFHLDGYKHKEEMSPVSPLSGQTSGATGKRLGRSSPKANKVTSLILPLSSNVVRGNSSEVMEKNINTNTNSFSSSSSSSSAFDSTLADLWKDPCIAFAIKTLTGEESLTAATSSASNNNQAKQKEVAFFAPETLGNVNTGSADPGTTSEDIWKDPCIDFAIKTLTGAIPIELDEPDARLKPRTSAAVQEQGGRQRK